MSRQRVALLSALLVLTLLLAGCSSLPVPQVLREYLPSQAAPTAVPQAQTDTGQKATVAQADTGQQAPAAQGSNLELLAAMQGTLAQIYEQVNPSVVNIQVRQFAAQGFAPDMQSPLLQGEGSGFVWDREGHIVTNYHVVDSAENIQVTFHDGTTASGEVVGTDPDSDLAVVRVDVPAERLQPVQVADSDQVQVGQLAIAIGNPFGLEGTMTFGIISAIGRSMPAQTVALGAPTYTIPDIVQTDAPINPGNSGGVLLDDQGRVIGVTTAIESTDGSNSGIGFAVPSAIVQRVVPALIESGRFEHPWLGISGRSLTSDLAEAAGLDAQQRGVLVVDVTGGGPAAEAGLRGSGTQASPNGQQSVAGGDIIVAIDGQPVNEFDDVASYLARSEVGQKVELTVLRDGREETLSATLGARPGSSQEAQSVNQGQTPAGARLGIMGVTMTPELAQAMDLPSDQQGVLVQQVTPESAAADAGLRAGDREVTIEGQTVVVGGDVITAVNGDAVDSIEALRLWLVHANPGDRATLTVLRDGNEMEVVVRLGSTN